MDLPELLDRAVSLLYPQRCFKCGDVCEYDDFFCPGCPAKALCGISLAFENPLSGIVALYPYKGYRRKLVWEIKRGRQKRVYRLFGYQFREAIEEHFPGVVFDMIVPVPASSTREFNHAERLVEPLSAITQIPIYPGTLTRAKDSERQQSLGLKAREENARLSYKIGRPDVVSGRTILLVDDLITTGYTISACAKQLILAGASRVYALSSGYTPLPKPSTESGGYKALLYNTHRQDINIISSNKKEKL